MINIQETFGGGLDLLSNDTKIDSEHYQWLINAKNRFNFIDPNNQNIEITTIPQGIVQGGIGVGNISIIFVSGRAYWQRDGQTTWTLIPQFIMSLTATQFWYQAVPVSSFHFVRIPTANIHAAIEYRTDFKLNGSPACIVVQDGITQPYIIYWDDINQVFTSRITQNYFQWKNKFSLTSDKREYVPIGKQMMFLEGKLFIVAPDNKSVFHSITGRPLDFMVNVDTNGNKLPSIKNGDANSVSFAFDYDEITCLKAINVASSFVYATKRNIRVLTLDYNDTLFGEPRPKTSALLEAGIVNQYSLIDLRGDYAFTDFEGVKSFNAVQQLKFRGRNSNFSLQVSKLFHKVKQQNPCSIQFNNYCLFNVDTKYGNLILIFDALNGNWASFDITEVCRVKQFFITETLTESKLWAVTWNNKLYRMFDPSATRSVSMFRTKAFTAEKNFNGKKTSIEHKSNYFRPMFNGGTYDGNVTVIELVDEQESTNNRETKRLDCALGGYRFPLRFPMIPSTEKRVENPTFSLTNGLTGKKISYIIIWDNDAQLIEYEVSTTEMAARVSLTQQNKAYNSTYS